MADKQLQIKITASDSASNVFRALGSSAKQAASDITGGAKSAAASLKSLGDESGKTEKQIEAAKRASTAFGVAGATLGASVGLFSRSIVENNQNLNTLERTYGDATGAMKTFADQVQATTAFSSESAIQAENIFGTLVRNYGLSVEQAQQLVKVSTDLATTSGLGLEDVASRVQAAIRGEGEAAEALGLTMNQQSIDRNNLTLTMSNQEAAQFRLTALMEQTSFAEGAAGEKAQSTAGQIAQLNNKFQDMARGALEATGSLPQIVSGLTNIGAESGLAITGVVSLVKGVSSLGTAVGGVTQLSTAFAALSNPIVLVGGAIAVMSAIAIKNIFEHGDSVKKLDEGYQALANTISHMPDMGATVTQTQQATDAAAQLARVNGELLEKQVALNAEQEKRTGGVAFEFPGMEDGMARWSKSAQEVNNLLLETTLNVDEENKAVGLINETINTQGANLDAVMPRIQQLLSLYELWITSNGSMGISGDELLVQLQDLATHADTYGDAAAAAAAVNTKFASSYVEVTNAIAGVVSSDASDAVVQAATGIKDLTANIIDSLQYFTATKDAFYGLSGGAEEFAAVQKEVFNVIQNGTAGQITALGDLERAHANGQITADAFAAGLLVLSDSVTKTSADAKLAEAEHQRLAESMSATEVGARKAAAGVSELSETASRSAGNIHDLASSSDGLGASASRAAVDVHNLFAELERGNKIAEIQLGTSQTVEREYGAWRGETNALTSSHDKLGDSLSDVSGKATEYASKLDAARKASGALSTSPGQFRFDAGVSTPSIDVAVNLQVSKSSLDAVMGVIKTAQGLSSQLGETKSFADELIGDPGTWAQMDQLLQDGRISWRQWQAAQEAQVSITRDVANAQQDLLAVQVNLAPTLAEAVNEQANYINSLQDMTATQQMAALGWMDNAEAAKAMSLAQLVAASTTDTMQASTQEMITAAAAADPVLKAMLEDMGLISAEDGTVNFDTNAETIQESVDHLTTAILGLTDVIINVPFVTTDTNAPDTQIGVDNLHGAIDGIPDSHGTNIYATDNASGVIGGVSQELDNINGKTASTYLNNYVTTFTTAVYSVSPGGSGLPAGTPIGGYTGLTVSGFAGGGTISGIPTYITGGTHAIVGERGPELVWLPNGSQVTNTEGSKAEIMRMRKSGGGGTINIYGPMTLNPASSDAYEALQQEMRGGARR